MYPIPIRLYDNGLSTSIRKHPMNCRNRSQQGSSHKGHSISNFFCNLPDDTENKVESSIAIKAWGLK